MAEFLMDAAASWLEARQNHAGDQLPKFNGSISLVQAGTNGTTTSQLINQFKLNAAVSVRNSTIILAAFNSIAGFATACALLFENHMRKRRNRRELPSSPSDLPFIQSTEMYPFILSIGIVIQGITYAAAQAQGLESIFARGCTLIAQYMLPAVFIVPYIQMVFGAEVAIRGLGKKPFAEQRKWTTSACVVLVGALLLVNFLVSKFTRAPDFCFASLFWFVGKYAVGCFAVLLVIVILHLLSMMVIFLRLRSSTEIETTQRVIASRMVYFLALATLTTIMMLPFFYSLAFTEQDDDNNNTLMLSMVASVAADLTGLMTGGLQLLFRSNMISAIGPKDKAAEYERQKIKHQIRHFNPDYNNDNNNGQARVELSAEGPRSPKDLADLRRMLSDANVMGDDDSDDESGKAQRMNAKEEGLVSPRTNHNYPMDTSSLRAPDVPFAPKKDRKSILSTITSATIRIAKPMSLLPSTVYNPNEKTATVKPAKDFSALKPPPSIKNFGFRHRRDSSMISMATVQIGLRLSNFEDMVAPQAQVHDPTVHSLDCPKILAAKGPGGEARRPSPLFAVDNNSPTSDKNEEEEEKEKERERVDKMKDLPPAPRQSTQSIAQSSFQAPVELPAPVYTRPQPKINTSLPPQQKRESGSGGAQTLSPNTYNPNSPRVPMRTPSPRGVGFGLPSSPLPRSGSNASTAAKSPTAGPSVTSPSAKSPSSMRSPPPRRTTGEAKLEKHGQWI